jgi:hypothetical protein
MRHPHPTRTAVALAAVAVVAVPEHGGGRLVGDAARCELLPGSEGCILDTFTGHVGA